MVIDGVGDLLSTIARCCRPVPPEPILGLHHAGTWRQHSSRRLPNLLRLRDAHPQRVLAVDWGRPVAGAHVPGRDR